MSNYSRLIALALAMLIFAPVVVSAEVLSPVAARRSYFEKVRTAAILDGDRPSAYHLRGLSRLSPTIPAELSPAAVHRLPQYAEQYAELRARVRRAILNPVHAPTNQWRVDRAEPALHYVSFEMEKSHPKIAVVSRWLHDAAYSLDHTIFPEMIGAARAYLTADPDSIQRGQSSILTWRSENATEAFLDGQRVELVGTRSVFPTATTPYQLRAVGRSGDGLASATVVVQQPAHPIARIRATPDLITRGDASTLTWNTENATEARLDGITVALAGVRTIRPDQSRFYEIVGTGPGGRASALASVTVIAPLPVVVPVVVPEPERPTARIQATPDQIIRGQTSTLTWNTEHATDALLNGASVAVQGVMEVRPDQTHSYEIVGLGAGGRASAIATVNVQEPPQPTARIQAVPAEIVSGEASTLTWNTENTTDARLDGASVALRGDRVVHPDHSRSYEIMGIGPGGSVFASTFVTVVAPVPAPAPAPVVASEPRRFIIHFDFDQSLIREDAEDTMQRIAQMMRAEPELRMQVTGHTDARGTEDYNISLSDRRAIAVRDYFATTYGIAASRLDLLGKGENEPIAPNTTQDGRDDPDGRQMNRRAEFVEILP